jgi:hypothetical protein
MSERQRSEATARLAAKLALLTRACGDGLVTDAEFRHLYALIEMFHSTDSGHCNPSDAKLGAAVGGRSERTVGTRTRSLQARGYLTKTPTRGASNYTFPGIKAPEGRQHLSDLKEGRSATSCNKVGNIVSEGRQQVCRAEPLLEPLLEPKEGLSGKGEGIASEANAPRPGRELTPEQQEKLARIRSGASLTAKTRALHSNPRRWRA